MWVVPGATQRYIRNKSQGVRDKTLGLILHVQVGNGELTGWYNNPGSEASSAWQAMKSGKVFQFGDPDVDKFWTQGAGNPDYGAVESEGYPSEPMTDAQLDAIARIYAEGHKREGWPFQLAEKPGQRGLGWHGMGGAAWGNHPYCPGTIRKAQRSEILARAKRLVGATEGEWWEMAEIPQSQVDRIAAAVTAKVLGADVIKAPSPSKSNPYWGVNAALEWTLRRSAQTYALVAAMAKAQGVDEKVLAAAIAGELRDPLVQAITEQAGAGTPEQVADAVVAKLAAQLSDTPSGE